MISVHMVFDPVDSQTDQTYPSTTTGMHGGTGQVWAEGGITDSMDSYRYYYHIATYSYLLAVKPHLICVLSVHLVLTIS